MRGQRLIGLSTDRGGEADFEAFGGYPTRKELKECARQMYDGTLSLEAAGTIETTVLDKLRSFFARAERIFNNPDATELDRAKAEKAFSNAYTITGQEANKVMQGQAAKKLPFANNKLHSPYHYELLDRKIPY